MIKINGTLVLVEQFNNHETKVKDFTDSMVEGNNIIELKYHTDADLIALMFVKKRLDEFQKKATLFLWYMPYSRMDRKIEGDVFSLQYICDFLNGLCFDHIIVMEPHSMKTMELLHHATAIFPVKEWLGDIQKKIQFDEDKDCIVFPDKGAANRYADCVAKHICILEKKRNPYTRKIDEMYIKEGSIQKGAKCIIIDDLCAKGDTVAWAANILKYSGASNIYVLVSHCEQTVFAGKILLPDSPIETIYTSSSMMHDLHEKIQYMEIDVKQYIP